VTALRTARSVLGLLRQSLWLRLLLVVAVLSVAFVFLGRWQLHRHEAKVARNAVIDANYTASPVALAQVLPDTAAALPPSRQWTPVEVTGVYEPGSEVIIRNRPLNGDYGYEVVVPLRTASGASLLVDRGWLPPGEDFVRPASIPAPPGGTVTVVVRLRPGEPPLAQEPPPGQELRIDLPRIAARTGGDVYRGAYGVLASEQPRAAGAPTLLPRPDQSLGPHLAYAYQWWFGALAAWALLGYYAVREVTEGGSTGPSPGGPSPGSAGDGDDPGTRREPRPREPRRRPRALTDEEYEDAASG
jgi:cytochrome oxidase assembly protein ShyY1